MIPIKREQRLADSEQLLLNNKGVIRPCNYSSF